MYTLITVFTSALLAGSALAQSPNATFNSTVISQVAGEIGAGTASAWCNSQYRACNVLCNSRASNNTCTASTLAYTCTCASNSSSPAFEFYNPTMITNICNRYLGDCLATNANFQDLQDQCKQTIICGNSSIDAYANGSDSSSASSSSTTMSATMSGTSQTASASPSTAAAAALQVGANYGTGIVGAIVLAVFGLAL